MNKKQKKMLIRIITAAVLMVILHFAYEFLGADVLDENGNVIKAAPVRWRRTEIIPRQ